jgi:AraC-like DNA-binding protein
MVNVLPTIIYSAMIGMVVLALLDVVRRPQQRQTVFLQGLLLLLLVHLGGELFIYSGAYVYAPGLAGAQFPFRVLLGPALYFYAHASMSAEATISKRLWGLALSGPVLVVLAMLPFMFALSPEEKLALANPATRDPVLWKIAVFTCLAAAILFVAFTALFLAATFKLHNDHRRQLMDRFAEIDQRSLDWLRPVLILWGLAWFMYAIEFSLTALGLIWAGSGILLPAIEAIALGIFIQKALNQKVLQGQEKGTPQTEKQRPALLSVEKMQLVSAKLQSSMEEDHLYLQDDLSLNKLSNAISESENHISETLSQFLDTNFFQYVNNYRVEAAKVALRDKNRLITSIAYDVGFNSKSTFNTAFKKQVGQSPSAYRNLLQDEVAN